MKQPKQLRIDNSTVRLSSLKLLGSGGEADVYEWQGQALKVFKTSEHPDFLQSTKAIKAAVDFKLSQLNDKLKQWPIKGENCIIGPEQLILSSGTVAAYLMKQIADCEPLYMYCQRRFRDQAGIKNKDVASILADMHRVVQRIHSHKVVIGDFNDLNVLVDNGKPYFIDCDSWQYGKFISQMFTQKFADPLHLQDKGKGLSLVKPHNTDTDWYAFAVMVMNALLFIDPYGGVYRNKKQKLTPAQRVAQRVTVFNANVLYPKFANPLDSLSDDMLRYFHDTFVRDMRTPMPVELLADRRWESGHTAVSKVKETLEVNGTVTAVLKFTSNGYILHVNSNSDGSISVLEHVDEMFKINKKTQYTGKLGPGIYTFNPNFFLLGDKRGLRCIDTSGKVMQIFADDIHGVPIVAANKLAFYTVHNGELHRHDRPRLDPLDQALASTKVCDVLQDSTRIWVGDKVGVGCSKVLSRLDVFLFFSYINGRTDVSNINDFIPSIGFNRILDSRAYISSKLAWLVLTLGATDNNKNKTYNLCVCVDIKQSKAIASTSSLDAPESAIAGDIHGYDAFGNSLFIPTDDGIKKLNETCDKVVEFPDTSPFVDSNSRLLVTPTGIHSVSASTVTHLSISS